MAAISKYSGQRSRRSCSHTTWEIIFHERPSERGYRAQEQAIECTRERHGGKECPSCEFTLKRDLVWTLRARCFKEKTNIYLQAIGLYKELYGEWNRSLIDILEDMGSFMWQQNRFAEAEDLHERSLEIRDRMLPTPNAFSTWSRYNLALPIGSQGRYEEAEPLFKQVSDTRMQVYVERDVETMSAMDTLAVIWSNMHLFDEATALWDRLHMLRL